MTGQTPPTTERKKARKTTKAEKIRRVDVIFGLLSKGFTRSQICQYVTKQEEAGAIAWGVSERTIDRYIQAATARFEEVAEVHNNQRFGRALTRLDDLYARTVAINDYKTALSIVKAEADLIGLTAPKRIEADVNLSTPEGLLALFRAAGKEIEKAWAGDEARPAPDDDPDDDEEEEEP